MSVKGDSARRRAQQTFTHYMIRLCEASSIKVTTDMKAEWDDIIEDMIIAAVESIKGTYGL